MWQWLAALAATSGAGAAQTIAGVSSPRNDYNLSYDRAERMLVFARSDADFANARINTAASESDFTLGAGGRRAVFWRMVGDRGLLHTARRTRDGWSGPRPLPDRINIGPFNFTPSLERDGKRLRFASTRSRPGQAEGLADIYVVKLGRMPN